MRIAAIVLSLTLLTLLVIPAVYVIWRSFSLRAGAIRPSG